MRLGSIGSMPATKGAWIGFAVLFPIGAVLAAATWVEVGQVLFELADLTCAACVDPNDGIDTAAAAAGVAGAGAAAAGAAGAGGSARPPNPRFSDPATNPRLPGPEDDVGDTTSPYQQLEIARDGAPLDDGGPGPLLRFSRQLERWAKDVMGEDQRGTTGPSHGGGMSYDADYEGRDYKENPIEPPSPRDS